jgi:hypothetical protein
MGIGATDFIRLLMRKSTFDCIRLLLEAFVDAQRCVKDAVTDWAMPDLKDEKRYLDPPVIFWSSRRMARTGDASGTRCGRRIFIFLAGCAPFPVSQAELGPFRLSQLDRSHNDQRSQRQRIPRYGARPALKGGLKVAINMIAESLFESGS